MISSNVYSAALCLYAITVLVQGSWCLYLLQVCGNWYFGRTLLVWETGIWGGKCGAPDSTKASESTSSETSSRRQPCRRGECFLRSNIWNDCVCSGARHSAGCKVIFLIPFVGMANVSCYFRLHIWFVLMFDRFDTVDVSSRLLVPIIVLRNHLHYNILQPGSNHSIDVDEIRKQVRSTSHLAPFYNTAVSRRAFSSERILVNFDFFL